MGYDSPVGILYPKWNINNTVQKYLYFDENCVNSQQMQKMRQHLETKTRCGRRILRRSKTS